jgi:hypothetical protein
LCHWEIEIAMNTVRVLLAHSRQAGLEAFPGHIAEQAVGRAVTIGLNGPVVGRVRRAWFERNGEELRGEVELAGNAPQLFAERTSLLPVSPFTLHDSEGRGQPGH